jgi:ERCC4-type nuclease
MATADDYTINDYALGILIEDCPQNCIIYDSREPIEYISRLQKYLDNEVIEWVQETLPIGDYIVNGTVIERKTPADFLRSIYPNPRLNNQLVHMSRNCPESVLAIIGDPWDVTGGDPVKESIISSALAGVWKRRAVDGCQGIVIPQIFFAHNADKRFALWMKGLSRKDPVRELRLNKTTTCRGDQLIRTLSTIPGWGVDLAQRGLELYGSIQNLMNVDPDVLCKEIVGIGEKKAKTFYEFFRRDYRSCSDE